MCEAAGQDDQLLSEVAALFEACSARTQPASPDELGPLILERAVALLRAPGVVLCEQEPTSRTRLAAARGVSLRADGRFLPRLRSIAELIRKGDPMEVDGRSVLKALGLPVRSNSFDRALCAAADARDPSAVLLFALRNDGRPFGAAERALAQVLAACAGWAVAGRPMPGDIAAYHEGRLREALGRESLERAAAELENRLAALRRIALELASGGDSLRALQAIANRAVELAGASGGAVLSTVPGESGLEAVAAVGECKALLGCRVDPGDGALHALSEAGELVSADSLIAGWADAADLSVGSVPPSVMAPACWGDELFGALVVAGGQADRPAEGQGEMLALLAALAAAVISNQRLLAAERQQRELSDALAQAAFTINSTLHLDQVLDHILEQVQRVVPGDAVNVMLVDGGTAHIVRERGYQRLDADDDYLGKSVPIADYPPLARMLRTAEPAFISDTRSPGEWVAEEGQQWLLSYVGAPIRVGDVIVGFLNVDGTRPGQFGAEDGARLSAFAGHAAVAIENALLYRRLDEQNENLELRVHQRTVDVQAEYAQLEAILDSSSDGIVVVDGGGSIMRTNRVAETWLTQSLSPGDGAALREAILQIAGGGAEGQPGRVLELTGLDLHLSAARVSEEDRAGRPSVVVALHDVTPLNALSRMKSQFVSNVSHELRTPVTTIKLYTSLLRDTAPERQAEYLDRLEAEADRQACLIEDILQISQIDLGRIELDLAMTDLADVVRGIVDGFALEASTKGVEIQIDLSEECPLALADADRISHMLRNLVANAMRHTREGGRIVVATRRHDAEGRVWATLSVQDDGSGIPEDELPYVFERFFRGRETREMQAPGTGVGLALSKAIADLHGGRITVQSRLRQGSVFTVWLPSTEPGQRIYRQARLEGW